MFLNIINEPYTPASTNTLSSHLLWDGVLD